MLQDTTLLRTSHVSCSAGTSWNPTIRSSSMFWSYGENTWHLLRMCVREIEMQLVRNTAKKFQ